MSALQSEEKDLTSSITDIDVEIASIEQGFQPRIEKLSNEEDNLAKREQELNAKLVSCPSALLCSVMSIADLESFDLNWRFYCSKCCRFAFINRLIVYLLLGKHNIRGEKN